MGHFIKTPYSVTPGYNTTYIITHSQILRLQVVLPLTSNDSICVIPSYKSEVRESIGRVSIHSSDTLIIQNFLTNQIAGVEIIIVTCCICETY